MYDKLCNIHAPNRREEIVYYTPIGNKSKECPRSHVNLTNKPSEVFFLYS